MRDLSRGKIVFTLIEERTRLLAGTWRHNELHTVLHHFDLTRIVALERTAAQFQPFQLTNARIVQLGGESIPPRRR